jgi:hypothetical protein
MHGKWQGDGTFAELNLLAKRSHGVVDKRIDDAGHREHTADDGADASEEMGKGLGPFGKLDHDRGQIVHNEHAYPTASVPYTRVTRKMMNGTHLVIRPRACPSAA